MLLKIKILGFALVTFQLLNAQFSIDEIASIDSKANSPYSRFGIGDLNTGGFAHIKGMGNAGIALKVPNTINILNPASFSQQDTLAFILDVGYNTSLFNISSGEQGYNTSYSNIDHIAIAFTIAKWWGASAGLMPYSRTGYNIVRAPVLPDSSDMLIRTGNGELNRLYLGNAFDLGKNLSIGANANYIFGKQQKTKSALFTITDSLGNRYQDPFSQSYFVKQESLVKGFVYDFGLLYTINLNKSNLNFGLIYQPVARLKTKLFNSDSLTFPRSFSGNEYTAFSNFDTLSVTTEIPSKLGFGLSFEFDNKIIASFDYKAQDWTNTLIDGARDGNLTKSQVYNAGLQYIPDSKANKNYLNKIRYRVGAYYNNSPIKINNEQVVDKALTIGLGLPFKNTSTIFNLSCQAGIRGAVTENLVEEKYIKINLNVSFFDFWFYKPKFD